MILEIVARSPEGLTLKQLSTALGAPNSSILQLLSGLVARGYLAEHGKVYNLGPGVILLANVPQAPTILKISHSYLTALNDEFELSVHLSVRLGDTFVAIDQVGLTSKLDFFAWNGMRRPLLKTAAGKIILNNLPDIELNRLLKAARAHSPKDVEAFLTELPDIRRNGLALNRAETIEGVFSVAAAAYDREGNFAGAVSLSGSSDIKDDLVQIGERLLMRMRSWVIP
jgi:DNA-binding IclR family transcriptional regulator